MKVVVGIDGSECALRAVEQAAMFSRAVGAELVLLRILNPAADCADVQAASLSEATDQIRARWTSELDALARSSGGPSATADVQVKKRDESTAEAIVRIADEREARLLVVGTRGTGIARRALIGSIATQVLQRSHCPVMLVGVRVEQAKETLPYRVIVTTDGCPPSGAVLAGFARAVEGVPPENLSVTAVYVSEWGYAPTEAERTAAERRLSAFTAQLPQRLHPRPALLLDEERRGPTEAILACAKETGAHSIWMATQGASWPRQVFLGSVALNTVERAHVPVVLVRAREP